MGKGIMYVSDNPLFCCVKTKVMQRTENEMLSNEMFRVNF